MICVWVSPGKHFTTKVVYSDANRLQNASLPAGLRKPIVDVMAIESEKYLLKLRKSHENLKSANVINSPSIYMHIDRPVCL